MHFTYANNPDFTELMQGDVLKRTPEINELLHQVHPHFYHKDKYQFFMVLTQSCDLVRRDGNECKAPYITIAPVRSIDDIIARQIQSLKSSELNAEVPVLTDKAKTKLSEFLRRLFNNNEPGYFFLEAEDTDLPYDACAMLNLSIAIKSHLHYEKCLEAKLLQLETSFQAKLGWLVGQLYSRVGTDDWPQDGLKAKISNALKDIAIWVPDAQLKDLVAYAKQQEAEHEDRTLTADKISSMLRLIPDRKKKVMQRASEIINEVIAPDIPELQSFAEKVRKRLENDLVLNSFLK